jgi:hypothetical protein
MGAKPSWQDGPFYKGLLGFTLIVLAQSSQGRFLAGIRTTDGYLKVMTHDQQAAVQAQKVTLTNPAADMLKMRDQLVIMTRRRNHVAPRERAYAKLRSARASDAHEPLHHYNQQRLGRRTSQMSQERRYLIIKACQVFWLKVSHHLVAVHIKPEFINQVILVKSENGAGRYCRGCWSCWNMSDF